MVKFSLASRNGLCNSTGLKEQFDGGKLYLFAGDIPANADAALDMVAEHTQVVVITNNGGATGLTFATATNGSLGKTVAEIWKGIVALSGAENALTAITPTFYRYCAGTDNGRAAANTATGYRAQGTVGGLNSGADLQLQFATLTVGAEQPVGAFSWALAA